MATERMGRKKLLSKAGWVEVSVAPHGKRAALPRESIQGVLESHVEGVGAFITYVAGNAVTNLPVLDLYLPLLHEVLDANAEPRMPVESPLLWASNKLQGINPDIFPYPDLDFPVTPRGPLSTGNPHPDCVIPSTTAAPGNGDDLKAPQNT